MLRYWSEFANQRCDGGVPDKTWNDAQNDDDHDVDDVEDADDDFDDDDDDDDDDDFLH